MFNSTAIIHWDISWIDILSFLIILHHCLFFSMALSSSVFKLFLVAFFFYFCCPPNFNSEFFALALCICSFTFSKIYVSFWLWYPNLYRMWPVTLFKSCIFLWRIWFSYKSVSSYMELIMLEEIYILSLIFALSDNLIVNIQKKTGPGRK